MMNHLYQCWMFVENKCPRWSCVTLWLITIVFIDDVWLTFMCLLVYIPLHIQPLSTQDLNEDLFNYQQGRPH